MAERKVPKWLHYLDENIENIVIFPMYFAMMMIMAIDVIRRNLVSSQWPWGIYTCIFLFVWFSWLGCSYNVKQRAHLRLSSLRDKLPRKAQFGLLMLDYSLWFVYGIISVYFTWSQIVRLRDMEALVYGTEWLPMWIAPACIPVAFALLMFRVVQCALEDIKAMRTGEPLQTQPKGGLETQV
ncbi:MAG: TRAP transporter small permease subunit [Syntrophobacteraceae bacterium]